MNRIALLAGAGSALFATPALAMDEGAIIAMLCVLGAFPIGVVGGGVSGWQRRPFFSSLGWTFVVGVALMLIALLIPRGGWRDYVEALLVGAIVAAIPLSLAFSAAYGVASLISNRPRKASQ